jgi:hypothetical protein
MLKVYEANSRENLNIFINSFMNHANDWAISQPDCSNTDFPVQFTIVTEPEIKLATIHILDFN